jgi:pyruvate dehydrogenase E2 component (dihydrolipoamide acetyltransferase)
MAENIIMPQLGESIAEGTIVKWLKEPGSSVKKDENVLLISTDKVEAEIPSPSDGILLNIAVGPGQTVPVGTVLGQVGAASEQKAASEVKSPKSSEDLFEKVLPKAPPPAPSSSQIQEIKAERNQELAEENGNMAGFFSPLVRRIAQEHGLSENEISGISGTGRGGRVSKNDVLGYVSNKSQRPEASKAYESPKKSALQQELSESDREILKPISTMRRVIMENMIASKSTSAHVTTFFEIDYTAIDKVRMAHKDRFVKEEQVSLTYTTFLAAAICQVLKRHPYLNASLTKDGIRFKKDIHLGIAVALEEPEPGLMVPVIKNADKQNLRGLAHTIADLSKRVRGRKISPDELSGGTFTITNPGNYGALIGTPIINQPQVAILGVGNIQKRAIVIEVDGTDVIAIRRMGLLGLSFDHRLIDGATADIFMRDLKQSLETWNVAP